MSTPVKMPRTLNEQYEIVRAAHEEQRNEARRKTSVKHVTTPSVCRRIIVDAHAPMMSPSVTTPHARHFESQPNDAW